jgi:hypothetical protein
MYNVEDSSPSAFIRERDVRESRNFLVGLGNGIWMSVLLTLFLYWFMQVMS